MVVAAAAGVVAVVLLLLAAVVLAVVWWQWWWGGWVGGFVKLGPSEQLLRGAGAPLERSAAEAHPPPLPHPQGER